MEARRKVTTSPAELFARLPRGVAIGLTAGSATTAAPLATGWAELDERLGGIPRGGITELVGPASSGKLSLALGALRSALDGRDERGEGLAALVDLSGTAFPTASWAVGRLLVVRPERLADGLRALDLLLSSGGLDVVGLELSGRVPRRGLPEAVTVRAARLARETGTAIVACADRPAFGSLASLRLCVRPLPREEIRIEVAKNRRGQRGTLHVPRPFLPFSVLELRAVSDGRQGRNGSTSARAS